MGMGPPTHLKSRKGRPDCDSCQDDKPCPKHTWVVRTVLAFEGEEHEMKTEEEETLEQAFLVERVSLLADENGMLRKRVDVLEEAVYLLLSRVPPIETNCMRYRKLLEGKVSEHEHQEKS